MGLQAIATVALGGLAIGIGHSLVQAIHQIKAACLRKSTSHLEASQGPEPNTTSDSLITTLELSTHFRESQSVSRNDVQQHGQVDILGVAIPDAVLAFDDEINAIVERLDIEDYLNVDIPDAFLGWDDAVETIAKRLDNKAFLDENLDLNAEASTSYQQDDCQFSHVIQTAGILTPTSSQPAHGTTSTTLTLSRPSTHLDVMHIVPALPASALPVPPKTSTAIAAVGQGQVGHDGINGGEEDTADLPLEESGDQNETLIMETADLYRSSAISSGEDSLSASIEGSSTTATSHEDFGQSLEAEISTYLPVNKTACDFGHDVHAIDEHSENQSFLEADVEKQHLEEALLHQQSVCSSLRSQLVNCEAKLEDTEAELRETKRQRDLYEEESEETSLKVRQLRQDLAVAKRQGFEEQKQARSIERPVPQVAHTTQGFNVIAIIEARDRALEEAQSNHTQWKYVEGMLKVALVERDGFKRRLERLQNDATQASRQLHAQLSDAKDLENRLRFGIQQLDRQLDHVVKQKKAADDRVGVVESYNKTLLSEYAVKHALDPQVHFVPNVCKPNELRHWQQALEVSMHNHEKANEANTELHELLKEKNKEVAVLRADNGLLKDKAARYASHFEVARDKLGAFMRVFPSCLKRRVGVDVDDVEGFEEALQKYEGRETETIELLKAAADDLSTLDRKVETQRRQYESRIESLTKDIVELKDRNTELDGRCFQLEDQLMQKEQEVAKLAEEAKVTDGIANEWRVLAEDKAYGKYADIIRDTQDKEVGSLRAQIEAVQWKALELSTALDQASSDNWWCREYYARRMVGVRQLGFLNDWHRQQVEALRERFREDLSQKPLNVPYKPDWSDISEEEKTMFLEAENEVIFKLTGMNMELGLDNNAQPKEVSAEAVWSGWLDEYNRVKDLDMKPWAPQVGSPLE